MVQRLFRPLILVFAISLLLQACSTFSPTADPTPTQPGQDLPGQPVTGGQPYQITGSFSYTNSIITDYYVEHAVALIDLYGYAIRDKEWEIPVASQTLGYLSIDTEEMKGEFILQLPVKPTGTLADVDNNNQADTGVQIFVAAYWPNLTGGPFSEGDDRSRGWPSYLTSAITDSENNDELIGGMLIVWAPDDQQQFPTGFGEDGLLFTADDPVGPLAQGYSLVNLDASPFTFLQEPEFELTLYEPQDIAIKDFSSLSYTEAFDRMFEQVRREYAFNGIQGKEPDWEEVYAEIRPLVQQAENNQDIRQYYLALREFTWKFKDGHVSLNGGNVQSELFQRSIAGGYGFAIRELDDGRVIATLVTPNRPAAQAGMQVGAEVIAFNGQPILDAISTIRPWSLPHSTDFSLRFQQARYLVRAELNTQASVTFKNPGGEEQTAVLTAVNEVDSFNLTSIFQGFDTNALPVEYRLLDSGAGYVRINTNYDDLGLIIKLFERALIVFQQNNVPGFIIDMRQNTGGAPLGLAGFLTDQEIDMGQLEYYSERTGNFEPEGVRQKILPNENQYRFDKMVLLVGQACFSACEIESFGFSQVPGMIVIGENPTAGVEAEVARGKYRLPEGFSLQIPTGRFTLPDGSIFLEGIGVQPNLRVPVNETTLLSGEDEVLKAGEKAILQPLGAGITPTAPPKVLNAVLTEAELNQGAQFMENLAREQYTPDELIQMDRTFNYTISLSRPETVMWAWGWCAESTQLLDENFSSIRIQLTVNGSEIPIDQVYSLDYPASGQYCRAYLAAFTEWTAGEHHIVNTVTITENINDGNSDFLPGVQVFDFGVYVKP